MPFSSNFTKLILNLLTSFPKYFSNAITLPSDNSTILVPIDPISDCKTVHHSTSPQELSLIIKGSCCSSGSYLVVPPINIVSLFEVFNKSLKKFR